MQFPIIFAYTEGDRWRPGIGDPTLMGWVTVAAYFGAALLCARTVARIGALHGFRVSETRFWLLLGVVLTFLGFNKQLDLQTWFTLTGKQIALAQGWYEYRRVVQALFIVLIAAAGGCATVWTWRNMRHAPGANWLALCGLVFLGSFIVIRAASFHMVDWFLKWAPGGIRMNWLLELSGIFMLAFAAVKRTRDQPDRSSAQPGELAGRAPASARPGPLL